MAIWAPKPQDSVGAPCALNPTEPAVTYQIPYSLRFRSSVPTYLTQTPATSSTNLKAWTYSVWVKRSLLTGVNFILGANVHSTNDDGVYFRNDGLIDFYTRIGANNTGAVTTNAVFRDPSAWSNFVFVYDSNNSNPLDRMRIYLNGNRLSVTIGTQLAAGVNSWVNSNIPRFIGVANPNVPANFYPLGAYLADANLVDGQALDANSFGAFDATTGVWMPKAYAGAYGTNGFKLAFDDAANLGKDSSGNNNHWTANNFSVSNAAAPFSDQMVDSPTNYGTDTGLGGEVRGN